MILSRKMRVGIFLIALSLGVTLLSFCLPRNSFAAINQQINFQGKLTNPDGTNVTNGSYSIRFRIYNDPTLDAANACSANSCKWEETQGTVSVTDGIFNVALGSSTTLPGSVDFNTNALYLGIKVGTDAEMTPRIQLTAAPYAFNADKLDGLDSTSLGQLAADQTYTGKNTFSRNGVGTADYVLGVTGTPINDATSSLIRVGNALVGGNNATNGGTYIGLNAPASGAGSAADLVNLQTNGTSVLQVASTGATLIKTTTNSATALQVQASGSTTPVLAVDTTSSKVNINGGLTINTADNSIVRTTTADFALGTVGASLTNTNNQIELSDGTIPNSGAGTITTAAQPAVDASVGAGASGITRADGKYLIIKGGAGTATSLYDAYAGTFTNSQTLSNAVGVGSVVLPRPGNLYLVISGAGATTTTNLDPTGTVAASSGPALGTAAGAGTVAYRRPDGKFLIALGASAGVTSVYDPIANTFAVGPTNSGGVTWGVGALALPRPDGTALFIVGGSNVGTTQIYDPGTANPSVGVFTGVGPNMDGNQAAGTCSISNAGSIGSVALRRADGKYVVLSKANVSTVYDPVANTFTCRTSGPGTALGDGAHAIPLQNSKFLVIVGGASTASYIYDPSADTFTAQGTALSAVNTGAFSLMRPDGTWQVINGSGTTTNNYNTNLPMNGTTTKYTSDDISTTALNTSSILRWTAQYESPYVGTNGSTNTAFSTLQFFVRTATNGGSCTTALNSATDHELLSSGDSVKPSPTDNCIRVTVQFNRPIPKRIIDERGTWTGNNSTVLRLDYATPTLFDWSLDNSTVLHRDNFTFSEPSAQQGNNGTIPAALTSNTPTAGGSCTAGTHFWFVTFITNGVESRLSPASAVQTCSANGTVSLTGVPTGVTGSGTTARKIYRTRAAALVTDTPYLLTTINDNVTTTFSDTVADGSLGAAYAQTETSGPTATRVEAINGALTFPYGRITPTTLVGTTQYYLGNTTAAHPSLPTTATTGTIVIARPNKTFLVLEGGANAATLYDPASQTFTTQSSPAIPTATIGAGGFAWKRPDGKYLVVLGNASTTTNIYDPDANVFSAGPALTATAAAGASAIVNTDGTVTIVHGGAATTSTIYDPVRNTVITGPTLPTAANCGFWAIPLQNGMYKTFVGIAAGTAAATTSLNYNPISKTFISGTALASASGCGATTFQRQDGFWVALTGGTAGTTQTTSNIINPVDGTSIAGPAITNGTNIGSSVIPRADGTFLILTGNATTTSSIYIPYGGTFGVGAGIGTAAAGPTLATAVGTGDVSFQRPDGKWVILNGNATATAQLADVGWYADGQYLSEQSQVPALAAGSVLNWKQNGDNFVRMEIRAASSQAALATTGYTSVGRSGQSIGNAGGETWVQVEVNFRRDFPTFSGVMNGAYSSDGGKVYPYRTIAQPTVLSYSLNNGGDLLTLQDNGLNVFRVTSEGSVYTGQNGGYYSGGADLAENYTSTDSLSAGEVVSADASNPQGVKRSIGQQYQKDVLGVVSTTPGFVAGAFTDNSYPIALVGRVPVKISTENGLIKEGDYLTAASIPGYAMRATVAGRTLGTALESFDAKNAIACPDSGMGAAKNTQCSTITMFVNLTDYKGASVDALMAEDSTGQPTGDAIISGVTFPSVNGLVDNGTHEEKVLSFLEQLKTKQAAGQSPTGGDVLANNVSAVNEVISPVIVADIIRAKTIQATQIQGLEVYTDKVAKLSDAYAGLQSQATQAVKTTTTSTPTLDNVDFSKGTFSVSLLTLGDIESKGGLTVGGDALFKGKSTFTLLAEFLGAVNFNGDVTANGRVTFNKDAGGTVIIKQGASRATVVFDKPYDQPPIVAATLNADQITLKDGTKEDVKLKEQRLFAAGYSYLVSNVQAKGFTIVLNKNASEDLQFNWSAVAVKDPGTTVGDPDPAAVTPLAPVKQ